MRSLVVPVGAIALHVLSHVPPSLGKKDTCACNSDLYLPSLTFSCFVLTAGLIYGSYHFVAWVRPRLLGIPGDKGKTKRQRNGTTKASRRASSNNPRTKQNGKGAMVIGKGNKIARAKQKRMSIKQNKEETIKLNVQFTPSKNEQNEKKVGVRSSSEWIACWIE